MLLQENILCIWCLVVFWHKTQKNWQLRLLILLLTISLRLFNGAGGDCATHVMACVQEHVRETPKLITNSQWLSNPALFNCIFSCTFVILDNSQLLSHLSYVIHQTCLSFTPQHTLLFQRRHHVLSLSSHTRALDVCKLALTLGSGRCRLSLPAVADRNCRHLQLLNISPHCPETHGADRTLNKRDFSMATSRRDHKLVENSVWIYKFRMTTTCISI